MLPEPRFSPHSEAYTDHGSLSYSMGGREKSLEATARSGLNEIKKEAQEILSDGKQIARDAANKVTK